jgi:hypothetical protein
LAEEKKCGQLQAPKKPDRKWMNIKNISFEKHCTHFSLQTRAGPIPILSIGYRPILQAFRYVPIPKNLQILLSEKYLNSIEQAASGKRQAGKRPRWFSKKTG